MGQGVVVLVCKVYYTDIFVRIPMNCMNGLCHMNFNVYWMNCNEWIFNELWMNFELPVNFECNGIEYTNWMNWNFNNTNNELIIFNVQWISQSDEV